MSKFYYMDKSYAMPKDEPLEAELLEHTRQASVVIFRASMTDVRMLEQTLLRTGLDYKEVTVGFSTVPARQRFEALRRLTGWHTLPQVFKDGYFIGGADELLAQLTPQERNPSPSKPFIQALIWAGAIPFIAGALASFLLSDRGRSVAVEQMQHYGVVVLTFLGAVHWGRVLARSPDVEAKPTLLFAGIPALVGWLLLSTRPTVALPFLALAFITVAAYDYTVFYRGSFERCYRMLRWGATIVAVTCLLVTWWAALWMAPWWI